MKEKPISIAKVLHKFDDVLIDELSDALPPEHDVDYKIDLKLEVEPPNKALYRLNQAELLELKRQIDESLGGDTLGLASHSSEPR